MARKKRQRPGLSYFGRKVETQQIRFDKDVFFEKNKSVGVGGALTTVSFDVNGKAITEFQGRKINATADNNDAISVSLLIASGILFITPTADRTKALPSFTGGSSWNEYLLEDFSAFDFVVLNTSSSFSLTLVVNGIDLQSLGSLVIRPNSSGIFRIIRIDSSNSIIIRLGNDDSSLATLTSIVLDGNTITGVDDSSEFTDDDAHIMTSAAINDRFAQINADTTGQAGTVATIAGLAPNTATTAAAQPNITSLGTLTALQVDNINLDGSTITNSSGDLTIVNTVDDADIIFQSDDGSGGVETYFFLDGSASSGNPITQFPDLSQLVFGNSQDLLLRHDGTDSLIQNNGGDFIISQHTNDKDIIFKNDDGSGGTTEYFRVDGGSEKTIYTKPISLLDSVGLQLGTDTDAQIYHTGSEGTFINYTGNFRFIQSADNADLSFFSDDGSGGTTEYFKVDGSDERTLFSKKVKIDHDVSDASVATNALDIDVDIEGSDTISGDVTQKGLNIDVRSTATGGDTSDEHRLMGVYSRARTAGSGDADSVTGVYGLAESGRSSSATTSLMRGVQGIAYANDSAAATNTDIRGGDFSCYVNTDGPDVTSMYGVISNAYTNTNSTDNVSNVSGLYGKAESRGSGTISTANGVYGEIEVDAGTITTGNCFRAVLDHNGGTLTTGYMFRGSAAGTIGTTIGVYIDGEDKNYFSNRVGIGTTSPSHLLHVNAADGVAVDTAVVKIRNQEATAGDNFGLYVQAGSNSSDISFRVADKDDNEYLRVRGDGNVGIGTASPNEKLEVDGNIKSDNIFLPGGGTISFDDSLDGTDQFITGTDSNLTIDGDDKIKLRADTQIEVKSTSNTDTVIITPNSGNIYTAGDIELGHASDTTISRSAAGKVTIEGNEIQTKNVHHHFLNAGFFMSFPFSRYIPLNGSINEQNTATASPEYVNFTWPYDGFVKKMMLRSETDMGSTELELYKGASGATVTTSMGAVTQTVSANNAVEFDFTSVTNTYSKGDTMAVKIDPTDDPDGGQNITIELVFDLTT